MYSFSSNNNCWKYVQFIQTGESQLLVMFAVAQPNIPTWEDCRYQTDMHLLIYKTDTHLLWEFQTPFPTWVENYSDVKFI